MSSRWKCLIMATNQKLSQSQVTSPPVTSPRVTVRVSLRDQSEKRQRKVSQASKSPIRDQQQVIREKENELKDAQVKIQQLKDDLEAEKTKVKEAGERLGAAARTEEDLQTQLSRSLGNATRLRDENRAKQEKIDKLERQVSILEDKLRSMESRGAEVEKLELMLETLRNRLDTSHCETREKEAELRATKRELETALNKLQTAEQSIEALTERVDDLKEQVKEELVRNDKMEQRVTELAELRELVRERDAQMAALQGELEQKSAVLSHARMTLREEREKIKTLRAQVDERSTIQEDMAITRAEALTLKRLLIGKDTLLVQKSQALDLAKEVIRGLDKNGQGAVAIQYLDQPRALYPHGAHFNDPDKRLCIQNGSAEDLERLNKQFLADSKSKGGVRAMLDTSYAAEDRPSGPDRGYGSHGNLLETLLGDDMPPGGKDPSRPVTGSGSGSKQSAISSHMLDRRPKTAVVKPQIYNHNQTFSNFRTLSNDRGTGQGQIRVKVNGHREVAQSAPRSRPPAGSSRGRSRWDSSTGTTQRGISRNTSSVWGEGMSVYERDALASKFVHLGDRVIIDLATKKGEKEKLAPGVVRFIGRVDKEVEDFRVHVGVKLDEPVGDMDGVYRGKRYFMASDKNGKLLKISKIKAVLHPKASTFRPLVDCIENYRALAAGSITNSSTSFNKLKST